MIETAALSLPQRALAIQERALGNEHLDVAASLQVLGRLHEEAGNDVSFAISTREAAAAALSLTSVLHHKGPVLDATSDNVARIRRSVAPADQALLDQLADVAGQLSSLTYGSGESLSPEHYRGRFTQLAKQREQLEADLASRSRAFKREVTPVTLANIQQAIPFDAALVELFRYTPFDPTKSIKTRRGPPRSDR